MGVSGLLKLISEHAAKHPIKQKYISNVLYIDFTSMMIECYEKYAPYINDLNKLIELIATNIEIPKKYNEILCFIDYRKNVIMNINPNMILFRKTILEYSNYVMNNVSMKYVNNTIRIHDELNETCMLWDNIDLDTVIIEEIDNDYDKNIGKLRYMLFKYSKQTTLMRRRYEKNISTKQYKIPFTAVLYSIPMLIKLLSKRFENIKFYGCDLESDFAIRYHIMRYNKNSYPTIITNDSDLVTLLNNYNCMINIKGYMIEPIKFWKKIFNCRLSTRVISILSVLVGTNYNESVYNSFYSILKLNGFNSFSEIDYNTAIRLILEIDDDELRIKAMIATNLYILNFECSPIQLTSNTVMNKTLLNKLLNV